jgi:tetratricopeptide (TPR) repeat protein
VTPAAVPVPSAPRPPAAPAPSAASRSTPVAVSPPRQTGASSEPSQFALSRNAIDIERILDELEGPPPTAHATSESVEVDLSIVLNDINLPARPATPITAPDIDGAFEQLRDQAASRSPIASAEAEYTRALAFRQAGDIDACIAALQHAARAPWLQFEAASRVAALFRERGELAESIEWLERAAEAPAPDPADAHRVLYDLADALEAVGESTRALAVCLELQADAGPYRDVADRVERLTRVQARG